jgi:hypothetical protein
MILVANSFNNLQYILDAEIPAMFVPAMFLVNLFTDTLWLGNSYCHKLPKAGIEVPPCFRLHQKMAIKSTVSTKKIPRWPDKVSNEKKKSRPASFL